MKTLRLEIDGTGLGRLLNAAEDRVVFLTDDGDERYALLAAEGGTDDEGASERAARRRLAGLLDIAPTPNAARRRHLALEDDRLTVKQLLALLDDAEDTSLILTEGGRPAFVLIALPAPRGSGADDGIAAAPRRERARGKLALAPRERPGPAGLNGGQLAGLGLLFAAIPAVNVIVSSVLYYLWRDVHPRQARQINLLGFAVFGLHLLGGILIAIAVVANQPPTKPPVAVLPPPLVKEPPGEVKPLQPPPKTFPKSRLVGYWSFDEGQDNRAANSGSSESGRPALLHGATWVPGKRGNAAAFDGSAAWCELMSQPEELNFKAGEDLTVSAWFKSSGQNGAILALRNLEEQGAVISLSIESGRIVGIIREDRGELGRPAQIRGPVVTDNRWHHVLLARSCAADTVVLHVDNVLIDSRPARECRAAGPITTSIRAIGCERYHFLKRQFLGTCFLNGCVDEVCIYRRTLKNGEILDLATGVQPPESW